MFLPYSFLISAFLIIVVGQLPVSPLRAFAALFAGFGVLYLWLFDRKRLYVNPDINADLERFEQSMATIGSYDKEYTRWLGSAQGQYIIRSIVQPVVAIALFLDCIGVAFYDHAMISMRGAWLLVFNLMGINLGFGY